MPRKFNTTGFLASRKDPAKRAEFLFGEPMKTCPKCGSWNFKYQTPIQLVETVDELEPEKLVRSWAKSMKTNGGLLEGPVFIMCFDCAHKGPAVDCTGRTSAEVGQDPVVSKEVRRLWNEQDRDSIQSQGD